MRFVPLLVLAAAGCGGAGASSGTSATSPSPSVPPLAAAAVSVAIDPDPVVATDSDNPNAPLDARWTVKITSSVAARVNFVNATLRDGASGARAEPSGTLSFGPAAIAAVAGTTRVEPQGSLAVAQSLEYGLPSGGRVGVLTVTMQLTDDDDHLISKTVQVAVN
jgi:hypothetical protein